MKKIFNSLIVAASLAFASAANAGIITNTDTDFADFEANLAGGTVVTQYLDNSNYINYQYKDNFVLLDIMVANFNYLFYEFSINLADNFQGNPLVNAYIPIGLDYYWFEPTDELVEIMFSGNQEFGAKIGFEINDALEFSSLDFGSQNPDDFAYIYQNDYQVELFTKLANFNVRAVGNNAAPVPEPSTLAIFALGMLGLVSRKLNKKS